jgi:hypothetical protein
MNPWFLAHVVAALYTTLLILVSQIQLSHAFSATVTWRHSTTSSPAAVFMVDDEHAACAAGLSQQQSLARCMCRRQVGPLQGTYLPVVHKS